MTPQTILLVDDDPHVLAALNRLLRRPDRRVLYVTNSYEATATLQRERVDLLISDNDMPGTTGVELLAAVRRSHADVVRILLTGRGSLESAVAAINRGEVYRYLTKPWDAVELQRTVDEALARALELRRLSAADLAAARRRRVLSDLARDNPGIADVQFDADGAHPIDDGLVDEMQQQLELG